MTSTPLVAEEPRTMAFTFSPHLDHIPFEDGDRAFCKACDDTVPLYTNQFGAGCDQVACASGHKQHRANLLITRIVRQS